MKKNVFNWLKLNIGRSFIYVAVLSFLGVLVSVVELLFVLAGKDLVNVATGYTHGDLSKTSLNLAVLLGICLLLNSLVSYLDARVTASLERKIKSNIFKRLIKKDYLSLNEYHTGDIMSRVDSDVNVIVSGVVSIIPAFLIFATLIIGGLILLYDIIPGLACVILVFCPVVFVFARIYSAKYKKVHKDVQKKDACTKSYLMDAMQNILVIKAFTKENTVHNRAYMLYNDVYKAKMKRAYISIFANIGIFLFFNAGYYFSFAYGVYMLNMSYISFGDLTAVMQLVNNIQEPFKSVSSLIPQYFASVASVERILELEGIADDMRITKEKKVDFESVVFDNVTFEYDSDDKVENISFRVKKGEFAAITGPSGSGKSTCLKLLMGVISPDGGDIYFESKDGKKLISDIGAKMFSYVPQGNLLMSGTIADNVTFFQPNPDTDKVKEALVKAQIWDYVSSLEEGADTYLGENGEGLSEGQAQRIAIARAIYHDADIILLDEATSALDDKTEEEVLKEIAKSSSKILIAVTHRKKAIDMCDVRIEID